jgi:hypothetical protein
MKKIYALALMVIMSACQKEDFEDFYADPSKLNTTTVEKQFTGFIFSNKDYALPSYWNYFVIHRITNNRYTQAVTWANDIDQYIPGGGAVNDRWNTYYNFMAQYRELQKVFKSLSEEDQKLRRIYMLAATVYLYDHTQQVVDLHGDIPFSEAGMLSTNGGDYNVSYPKYDSAESIYTTMLDDLKSIADELNTIEVNSGIQVGFEKQDLINNGDLTAWKRYVNSLRLRILTRVSGANNFSSRAQTEIGQIVGNPTAYPIVNTNAENIAFEVKTLGVYFNDNNEFERGLEDWNGNVAGKKLVDHMVNNKDPRLTYVLEPGVEAENGKYETISQLENSSTITEKINAGTLTIYNRSTLSRNSYFPGILISASQVQFMLAEYYLKAGNEAMASATYEKGIRESINFYKEVRSISNNSVSPVPANITEAQIVAYLAAPEVQWTPAKSANEKLALIGLQKWLHFNVVQPLENWTELRRLKLPALTFWVDQASNQTTVPARWNYPNSEKAYNEANYNAVASKDNLTSKLFWDTK